MEKQRPAKNAMTMARFLTLVICVTAALAIFTANARPAIFAAPTLVEGEITATTHVVGYQGRLLDPSTGKAKPDGVYTMTFRLYDAASAGAELWLETKDVPVQDGRFSTLLGDTVAMNLNAFNGQDLWLGVKVGADAEASPRQRIGYTAYALFSRKAGDADTVGGKSAGSFAPAGHQHDGASIVDGSVTADEIQDYVKTLTYPANALNYDQDSTNLTNYSNGILWKANFSGGASLWLKRPYDWDGRSTVTYELYFIPTTNNAGKIDFFIRPIGTTIGDSSWIGVSSFDGTAVTNVGANKIHKQTFSIPASRFGNNELWHISIQREGSESTYTDDVILLSVALSYTAVR